MNRLHHIDASLPSRLSLKGPLLALLLVPSIAMGQSQPTLTWQGEIRPRLYAREPVAGQWDHWIEMRTRLALDARMEPGLGFFIQIQDVRFWGEETSNRDRSADAVDFHQAYLEVDSIPGIGGLIRGGRQEVTLAEGRFIAAPNWGQAGQSFDGLRWIRGVGGAPLNLVYLRLREGSSTPHDYSADFMAGWLALPAQDFGSVEFLAIHDRSSEPDGNRQSTVGSIWKKRSGDLSIRVQGMYQFGERGGVDVSAHMLAAQGSLALMDGKGTVTLWYDHLSGDHDAEDDEVGAFSTLFGARHRYYGRADYFLNIPEDTGGLGLRDAALKLALSPNPRLTMNLDLHHFRTSETGTLSNRHLAEELDLWIRYRFREALRLEVGYSLTWAGAAMEELDRLEGTGNVGYVMTSMRF
ncbi:MAG: alginate export family protein [Gemmatimonadota bacterium]